MINSRFSRSFITVLVLLSMLAFTGFQPAYAVDKSRFFTWLMFFSGLGASTAGVVIGSQANETYDEYLHTAVRSDMDRLIDDYEKKHQQSTIASRTGIGLVIGAILISLLDTARMPAPEVEKTPSLFGDSGTVKHTQNNEILVSVGQRF